MSRHGAEFDRAQRNRDFSEPPEYWLDPIEIDCDGCIWNRFGQCHHPEQHVNAEGTECENYQT